MSYTTCTIRITKRPDNVVYISGTLLKSLKLSGIRNVSLKLGQSSVSVPVRTLKNKEPLLYIPERICNSLLIPRSGKCLIVSNHPREIRIGPLIGLLISPHRASAAQPLGARTAFIRTYLQAGAGKSYFFAFTLRDVNWRQETVNAFFPGYGGSWIRKTVPLPDVIFNRLASRQAEKSAAVKNLKERFLQKQIQLFNWSFFDKWDVYHLLEGEEASKYVPESKINPTADTIREMLRKHRFVYLKPTGGSLGIGIFRLTHQPGTGYFARFRQGGKNILLKFAKFDGLMNFLRRKKGNLSNHVLQQGIRLIEIDGRPIDFRFHLNKNMNNQWKVTGIGAKVAGKGSVTTHLRNGGKLMTPEQVLQLIYNDKAEQMLNNAKQAAIKLAEAIEKNYSYRLGELGFDIGIDQDGEIWMFEANAKPGRSIFKHPALKSQGKDVLQQIFEYCLYLSKFQSGREE